MKLLFAALAIGTALLPGQIVASPAASAVLPRSFRYSSLLRRDENARRVLRSNSTVAEKRDGINEGTPLKLDKNFPEDQKKWMQQTYDDAVALAIAGFDMAQHPKDLPFSRYFIEDDYKYVASVLDAFIISADYPKGSHIPEVLIKWSENDDASCKEDPSKNLVPYMFIDGNRDFYGPGSTLTICRRSTTFSYLQATSCEDAKKKWPRTQWKMDVAGDVFLHEWLHYDAMTQAYNNYRIGDQPIQQGQYKNTKAYGPFLSMIYKDPGNYVNAPRDNDDNFIWMAIEAYWRQNCPGYEPGEPVDEFGV